METISCQTDRKIISKQLCYETLLCQDNDKSMSVEKPMEIQ